MFCHLCQVDGSPSHGSSSRHRAAKELAAVAVDRLSDHLIAAIDDDPSTPGSFENLDDFLKVKLPKTAKADESNKTEVFFCDSCNITLPVSDLKSHQRQKKHTLALFNEQTLEELVGQYVDKEHRRLMLEPMREPQVSIEESEAAKTYTCHLCALEVPLVFKFLHEWGLRHRACSALAVSAAKRARDQLRSGDKSKDKSGDKSDKKSEDKSRDKSEEKSGDKSEDKSKDKPRLSGKLMKKLLKLYAGKGVDEDTDGEPEKQKCAKAKRLTAKEYFTDVMPYLSYVAAFHTVVVDDTEFVTIQVGRDTLKIHINNYNGLSYFERHGTCFMSCVLCDAFNASYSSCDEQDKKHVMSLGHIKNLLLPIDNVHLIRKIDETHAVCALCNIHVSRHHTESHILRDPSHTIALTEALERGKTYKHSPDHLKIMVYKPQVKTQQTQNKWNFGIPQAPKPSWGVFGAPCAFGGPQVHNNQVATCFGQKKPGLYGVTSTGFGSAPNVGFGRAQNNIASAGSTQNDIFGSTQKHTGFVGVHTASCGSAQNNAATFGSAQNNTGSVKAQKSTAFGVAPANTGFGGCQVNKASFESAQNNTASFGNAQNNSIFSSAQNNTAFGVAPANTCFGGCQNNTTSFGNAQNNALFGSAQNTTAFGGNTTNKGSGQFNTASFESVQNNAATFGSAQNNALFGTPQNNTAFGVATSTKIFGNGQNNTTSVGNAPHNNACDNKTLIDRFGQIISISGTLNKNAAAVTTVKNNTASHSVADTTLDANNDEFTKAANSPSEQSTSNCKNLASGLTEAEPSEKAENPKSTSDEKFTFISNAGTEFKQSSADKNGDGAQSNNVNNISAQRKPDVGKQNVNKRSLIHYSSSSSDSE